MLSEFKGIFNTLTGIKYDLEVSYSPISFIFYIVLCYTSVIHTTHLNHIANQESQPHSNNTP